MAAAHRWWVPELPGTPADTKGGTAGADTQPTAVTPPPQRTGAPGTPAAALAVQRELAPQLGRLEGLCPQQEGSRLTREVREQTAGLPRHGLKDRGERSQECAREALAGRGPRGATRRRPAHPWGRPPDRMPKLRWAPTHSSGRPRLRPRPAGPAAAADTHYGAVNSVQVVGDRLPSPRHGTLQGRQLHHTHDGADVCGGAASQDCAGGLHPTPGSPAPPKAA